MFRFHSSIICLLASCLAVPAQAERVRLAQVDLDQAVSGAPGRVLSAETQRFEGRSEHRLRVLTDDGRVRRLRIDAQTGQRLPPGQPPPPPPRR